jgi:hypothetical protein
MSTVEIDFEIATPEGLKRVTKRMPWKITMASSIRREKENIEKAEGHKLLHAFDCDTCLVRKYGLDR